MIGIFGRSHRGILFRLWTGDGATYFEEGMVQQYFEEGMVQQYFEEGMVQQYFEEEMVQQ